MLPDGYVYDGSAAVLRKEPHSLPCVGQGTYAPTPLITLVRKHNAKDTEDSN